MDLIPIQQLTLELIQGAVRSATEPGFEPDTISDFVGSVDWSGSLQENREVQKVVGALEHWDTEFMEGDITEAEYGDRLQSILSPERRMAV